MAARPCGKMSHRASATVSVAQAAVARAACNKQPANKPQPLTAVCCGTGNLSILQPALQQTHG